MMNQSKILIKALKINEEYIPIWEFKYKDDEDYGDQYYYKEEYRGHSSYEFKDMYYDLNTKQIDTGIKLKYYPKSDNYRSLYNLGDEVFIKTESSKIKHAVISEIVWEEDGHYIGFGHYMKENCSWFKDVEWDSNILYHLVTHRAKYRVEGNKRIIWDHDIFTL